MAHTLSKALIALVALGFGVLLAAPFIVARDGGVYPELTNDQNYYLARVQEVRDGHPLIASPYLAAYKDTAPVTISSAEIVMAGVLSLLDLPTAAGLVLFPFIFSSVLLVLISAIGRRLGAPRAWALIGAALVCVGPYFFTFARPVSPQFNGIFWLLGVLGLCMMAEKPSWKWVAVQALAVGMLFYIYPYYWTHLIVVYGLLAIVYRSKKIIAVIVGALMIGSGALYLAYKAHELPYYHESLVRLGFVATHSPSGVLLSAASLLLVGAIATVAWKTKQKSRPLVIAGALVMGGVIAMNQHLVTGINMEFSSHYALQIVCADLFLIIAAVTTFGWWPWLSKRWVLIPAAALVLVWSAHFVLAPYRSAEKQRGTLDDQAQIIAWLDAHAKPGDTVSAPENVATFIPAYTSLNVFFARGANFGFMPDQDVVDRFIIQNYAANFTDGFIADNERALFGQQYVNAYDHALQKEKFLKVFGIHVALPERIPQTAVGAVEARATELKKTPFARLIAPYHIAYVIAPSGQNPLQATAPVFSTARFEIFLNPL
jgi:hypothetical protein